jgi:NADH:ubiquinone oxidoreductase subunit 6 (subunit J)
MFRNAAEVIGCLIAPVPLVCVGVVESILYTRFDAVVVAVFLVLAYIGALGFTIVLGYPLYRLLSRLNAFRWWTSILSGFAVGMVVTVLTGHPANLLSNGVLINSLAAAVSGLLFWVLQVKQRAVSRSG